jgi:hypothetical protein
VRRERNILARARFTFAHALALAGLLTAASALSAEPFAISNVSPSSVRLDPAKGETLQLKFRVNGPANVTLQLYDGRELLIREVRAPALLPKGEHTLSWDLRDFAGKPVPPEAYTYVLEAQAKDGQVVRYDLADQSGGASVPVRNVQFDSASGVISYGLERPARVSIRIGLNDAGPLLRTVTDWVARPAGQQQEPWDGNDASGVLDLASHPRLHISVQAFALPENSILIGEPQRHVRLISSLPTPARQRPKAAAQPKRMYAHAQQPLESRGDFKVHLTLPKDLPRSPAGLPIVTARTAVRLDVDAADRERALARRFEPVFFIDGQFAFENEVGFVPMTWNFDPAALNDGEHFLTVNLRGYEGNFGMATLKVLVQRNETKQ